MTRTASARAIACSVAVLLALSACQADITDNTTGNGTIAGVHNPSDATGGTIRMANSGDWDLPDLADTYYAYAWNFARLYGRSLMMFKSAPGAEGATLVPDLAEKAGTPNADSTQWTYTLRQGVKFEDGTPATNKDVKYAVERSLDKTTFPNGPTYFNDFLDVQGYTSPYQDPSPDKLGLTAIDTPDDRTIVFTLAKPFSGFDYVAQLPATIPVPQAKDTGSKYKEHVVSTGPYMFQTNDLGKSFAMVPNPNWDQATDPNRKSLPDRIEVALNVNSDDIDNRLVSGDLNVAVRGTGVGPAAQGRILADPALQREHRLRHRRTPFDVAEPRRAPAERRATAVRRSSTLPTAIAYQRAYGGDDGRRDRHQSPATGDSRRGAVRLLFLAGRHR